MLLLYRPAKRRLAPDDAFFALGNAEAALHRIDTQLQLDPASIAVATPTPVHRHIICHDAPCLGSVVCPDTLAFERHYDQVHRNLCSVCNAILPTAHWLDLHVQERHDAFFSARVARGDKAFRCFLPTCARLFSRPQKRRLHMIDKHAFPRCFNWALIRDGLLPIDGHRRRRPAAPLASAPDSSAVATDLDSLPTAFSASLRVSAPKSISFGRRGAAHR
ncbi:hypothetical protein GGI04_004131 [Coemansia thaxteri]|uniref:C2H2-type domain-containing protein n=1 Tax=Coemansia thaxteri TaxID=2663907 RepID=A0A9W8BDU5_9FUNG|nr:hypothetical protein GGI04_004131 [Coemansia thaxteri]KAJ2002035.1 hypothetical protein H4R26_003812 [Coemansia thaxteri]KAJ2463614.1 hypothetical protein GGI02_005200 [Coemansia sp. RSA 2322]KAJ2482457.1 hypothetical protein EV174_003208 [Coemansia sp. RSA 2320]